MISRREILRLSGLTAVSLTVPSLAAAGLRIPHAPPRSLSIYNLHTDEKLSAVYWEDGRYLPDALSQIDYIMRDMQVFADKIARHPESLGLGGVVKPSAGLKESPFGRQP